MFGPRGGGGGGRGASSFQPPVVHDLVYAGSVPGTEGEHPSDEGLCI